MQLPAGLSFGKDAAGQPVIMGKDGKTLTEVRPTLLQDAASADPNAPMDAGKVGKAAVSLDGDGKTLVFTPDAAFLADPAVAYPVTMSAAASDWWEGHTGQWSLGGMDTFVNDKDYPDSWDNFTLDRILVGKSNSGTVRWRGYLQFPDIPAEFSGSKVQNADLILWNYLSNTCGEYVGSGITARRIIADWDETTLHWNSQPSVTPQGQDTEFGAYSTDCSGSMNYAWDLFHSLNGIVQAWVDGAPNYGIQLTAGSESDTTNWRRYRSEDAGGCTTSPLEGCKGTLHPPILTVDFEPPVSEFSFFEEAENPSAMSVDQLIANAKDPLTSPAVPAPATETEGDALDNASPWTYAADMTAIQPPPGATAEEIAAADRADGLLPGFPGGVTPTPVPEPTPVESAPTVTLTEPEKDATGVNPNVHLLATFSEAVTEAQIVLKDSSGAVVPGSVDMGPSNAIIRHTPNAALGPDTTYTATVTGAKDNAGNVMTPYSWSFTTGAGTPATGPIAHWTFDEGAGSAAGDSSPNGHDATLGNTSAWVTGKLGQAISNTAVSPVSTTAAQSLQSARAAAAQAAAKQEKRVEVGAETSEKSITYALPDGKTFISEVSAGPVRVRKDGRWIPIDTGLSVVEGTLRPKAVSAGLDIKLSNGGNGFLATIASGRGQMYALRWPTVLPKPVVSRNTATYQDAAGNGADLVLAVLPTGVRHDVVVRERPTSPIEIRMGVETAGLTFTREDAGRLLLKDSTGKPVAFMPEPIMWDGSKKGRALLAKRGKVSTEVVTHGGISELVLKPDHAFLTDSATVLPARVEATGPLPLSDDVGLWSLDTADMPAYPGAEVMIAGVQSGREKNRTYLRFDTTGLAGQTVTDAKLSVLNINSSACGVAVSDGIQVRRVTAAWSADNLHWANKPAATTEDAAVNKIGHGQSCSGGEARLEWPATGIAQDWAAGAANHGLVLQSPTETNVNWRYLTSSENTQFTDAVPRLTITTAAVSTPSVSAVTISPAETVNGTTVTSSLTPRLAATVADTIGGTLTGEFEVEHDPTAAGQGTGQIWTGTSPATASGGQAAVDVPGGKLVDGWKVRWRARAVNTGSSTASPWSDWQLVTVDPSNGPVPLAYTGGPVLRTDQSFSISAWARWSNSDTSQILVEQRGTSQSPFQLANDPVRGLSFTLTDSDGTTASREGAVTDVKPPAGEWFHVVAVYDADQRRATLYLNGAEKKAQNITFNSWNSPGFMTLGTNMNGDLDDTRIYQRALTAAEITSIHAGTSALRQPAVAADEPWQPEGMSFDTCREDNKSWLWRREENRPEGWYQNRFSWCYWSYVPMGWTHTDRNGRKVADELVSARLSVVGETTSMSRAFKIKVRLDDFKHIKKPPLPRIDQMDVMGISVESRGSDRLGRPVNNAPGVGNSCQASNAKKSDHATWALWESGYQAEFQFTSPQGATSDVERIHQCKLSFTMSFEDEEAEVGPSPLVKCDTASYITHFGFKDGGCVYKGITSSIVAQEGAEYNAQFGHFHFIRLYPQVTIPEWHLDKEFKGLTKDGDKTPGLLQRSGYEGIEQLNRKAARKECKRKWGPNYSKEYGQPDPDGIVDQEGIQGDCDEYPFNATLNGVHYQQMEGVRNYSVAVINGPENLKWGALMNRWFSRERVLDGDRFFVRLKY
ncbi:DNRLRE domain-containing protein [Nonomuraea typhae]|uniref:DNRLRE domain-containing protein n=1 Tax=Nonomuraea typhae TaxID=2603600 RepID=A0ABW7YSM0_9ACTN